MCSLVSSANSQYPRDQTFSTQQTAVAVLCDELTSPAATVVELNNTMYSQHSLTDFYTECLLELNYKCKINSFFLCSWYRASLKSCK